MLYAREGTKRVGRYFQQQFLHAGLQNDLSQVQHELDAYCSSAASGSVIVGRRRRAPSSDDLNELVP